MSTVAVQDAPPSRRRRTGLVVTLVLLLVVAGLLLASRVTAPARFAAWTSRCEARGGSTSEVNGQWNPLLVGSDASSYVCRAAHGEVLDTWG